MHNRVRRTVLAAMFLALALLLPFVTAQLKAVGKALCPMHFPVLLCGYFCGPWYAAAVGFLAPILRSMLFGMPPMLPTGAAMALELAAYGLSSALLDAALPKKKGFVYVSLAGAMLIGRGVWGAASVVLYGLQGNTFGTEAFLAGAFASAVPGIVLQLAVIPPLVMMLKKDGKNI